MSTPRKVQLNSGASREARAEEFARRVRELYATKVRLEIARTHLAQLELEQRSQQKAFADVFGEAVEDAGPVLVSTPCPDGTLVPIVVEMESDWWDTTLPVRLLALTDADAALEGNQEGRDG